MQDLYPDVLKTMGYEQTSRLYSLLLRWEHWVYWQADSIVAIDKRMASKLTERGVRQEKIRIIPNLVDTDHFRPLERDSNLLKELRIAHDHFVILYAGNVGYSHDIQPIFDAAKILETKNEYRFLIVCRGVNKEKIERAINSNKSRNVVCHSFLPRIKVPLLYAASDLCLVTLKNDIGHDVVPSKLLTIMACGKPVLAVADTSSSIARIVRKTGAGTVLSSRSGIDLACKIEKLKNSPGALFSQGRSGRKIVKQKYSVEAIGRQYSDLLEQIVSRQ